MLLKSRCLDRGMENIHQFMGDGTGAGKLQNLISGPEINETESITDSKRLRSFLAVQVTQGNASGCLVAFTTEPAGSPTALRYSVRKRLKGRIERL